MKVYCDITREPVCVGIIPNPGVEVIFTGTELHREPVDLREHPMALRLALECDLHFWFDDAPNELPFYTVPKAEVFAYDSRGGYFVTTGDTALDWSSPVYYLDSDLICNRIPPTGEQLTDMGLSWRETMIPSDEIEIFRNRLDAQKHYRILTLQELLEAEA